MEEVGATEGDDRRDQVDRVKTEVTGDHEKPLGGDRDRGLTLEDPCHPPTEGKQN